MIKNLTAALTQNRLLEDLRTKAKLRKVFKGHPRHPIGCESEIAKGSTFWVNFPIETRQCSDYKPLQVSTPYAVITKHRFFANLIGRYLTQVKSNGRFASIEKFSHHFKSLPHAIKKNLNIIAFVNNLGEEAEKTINGLKSLKMSNKKITIVTNFHSKQKETLQKKFRGIHVMSYPISQDDFTFLSESHFNQNRQPHLDTSWLKQMMERTHWKNFKTLNLISS